MFKLVTGSVTIFLVSFGSGIVAARSFSVARPVTEVDANQELIGLGAAANIAPGFFGSFPVSVSDSRGRDKSFDGRRFAGVSRTGFRGPLLIAVLVFLHGALRIFPFPRPNRESLQWLPSA